MRFECQSCLNVFDGQTATLAGPCPRCGSTYSIIAPTGASLTGDAGASSAGAAPIAPPPPPASVIGVAPTMAQPLVPPPGVAPIAGAYPPPPQPAYPMPPAVGAPAAFGAAGYPLPYAPAPAPGQQPQYFGQPGFAQPSDLALAAANPFGAPGMPMPAEQVNTTTPMILGIISLLCGCMPLGIASLVLSQQASEAMRVGDIMRAKDRVRTSTILSMVNIGLMVLGGLTYLVLMILSGGNF